MTDYTSPVWVSSALIVIDMQVDFADGGAATIPGTTAIAPGVGRLCTAYREAGLPIAHIVRLYDPAGTDIDLPRRALIQSGARVAAPHSPGSAIIPGLAAGAENDTALPLDAQTLLNGHPTHLSDREIVLFKPRWGAFYRTHLQAWLREQHTTTVTVAGCNLPNCPRATLFEASERDFRTVLAVDAVSQPTEERLADLQAIGVNLLTAAAIIEQIDQLGAAAGHH